MRPLLLCLFAMTALTLHGAENRWVSLDGKPMPAPKSYYNAIWQTEVIAPGEKPGLQLFPATKRPALGTIIVAPGGAYENLSLSKEGTNLAKPLNDAGWDAVVLSYTLGSKDEKEQVKAQALTEAEQALTLLQQHGAELGLSTTQIGAAGFSAGAHLMLRLAHETAASTPPSFLVIVYPAYLEKDGKLLPDAAPPKVPLFVCAGDQDLYQANPKALNQYCQENDIPCDYTFAPGVGHGFGMSDNLPEGIKDWPAKLDRFLADLPPAKAK